MVSNKLFYVYSVKQLLLSSMIRVANGAPICVRDSLASEHLRRPATRLYFRKTCYCTNRNDKWFESSSVKRQPPLPFTHKRHQRKKKKKNKMKLYCPKGKRRNVLWTDWECKNLNRASRAWRQVSLESCEAKITWYVCVSYLLPQ